MMIDQYPTMNNSDDLFNDQTPKKSSDPTVMNFSRDLVEHVITAVRCSLAPNSTTFERVGALKYLDDLKDNAPLVSLRVAFELFKEDEDRSNSNSNWNVSLVHHYGLHLIESLIKSKWTTFKSDEKSMIREQIFLFIRTSLLNAKFIDPLYIRNGLARCFVEMIKRDCFEKTNTTLDELISITERLTELSDRNSIQVELILLVYQFLNEDLTIYGQMLQAHRRRQLFTQLQKRLNELLPCFIRLSTDFLSVYHQNERLTQTSLLTLNSFLIWVDYQHFEQYELFLYQLFLKFFQLPSVQLRYASFEGLLSLVQKRLARRQLQQQQQQRNKRVALLPSAALNAEQEQLFLEYLFGDTTLEMFFRLLLNPTDSLEQLRTIVNNDHLNCLKLLGQFLVKSANYFLQLYQQITSQSIDDQRFLSFVNERVRSFLQFLLLLNQHPFHLLSLNSYQALNAFISKQPTLLSNENFCLKLVENLHQSLHRLHFPSSSTVSTNLDAENELFRKQFRHNEQCLVYVMTEYDSEEQFFWKFFSQYRTELQKLIKSFIDMFFPSTANENPLIVETNMSCLKSVLQSLLISLESLVQRTPTKRDDGQPSTLLRSTYFVIEWEAFYLLMDHVLFVVRKELFSSSTSTIPSEQKMEQLLMTPPLTEQFLRTVRFLLQFTPNLNEHIHGHVLNLLAVMFFITQHDSALAIQIIQRLLSTFQLYQRETLSAERLSSLQTNLNECEILQTQASNAFLYLCKNFTVKMLDYYSDLFPYLCQLYKDEFQLEKLSTSITIDESSSSTLKLLDAMQTLVYHQISHSNEMNIEAFYELVKPIYDVFCTSITSDHLTGFIDYFDFLSNGSVPLNVVRGRRRNLMLALHCLCLLIRYSKQEQHRLHADLRSKIAQCLRPFLFDYLLKLTQFCNQLYDGQINPYYNILKSHLTYSETEKQLYLGTYESNNMAKATITSTTVPSSLPVSYVRFQANTNGFVDDHRLRDYFHRLFDICSQINGLYFAHDPDLYHLKLNEDCYFLSSFLQKILFENLKTLPSFRLRIVLRHFCRTFVEHYSSTRATTTIDKDRINELFLTFLDIFLPYIQQCLTTMWSNLLSNPIDYQPGECSDEVIEECVCVLLTRDFVDIIRYFIYNTTNTPNKKKTKLTNGRQCSESICEESNGLHLDQEPFDEWDEPNTATTITNKFLNGIQEKLDYSDLFVYMMKMARQNSPVALRLFTYVLRALFECLTFPDAYCVNRFLPMILPLTKLSMDLIEKLIQSSSPLIDIKGLFQCLLKALERHNENEGVNTNLISLIGHIYELWYQQYQTQLDLALQQTIPQINFEVLNTFKTRLAMTHQQKRSQTITERERRDLFKNLLNPLLLAPMSTMTTTTAKKENFNTASLRNQSTTTTSL